MLLYFLVPPTCCSVINLSGTHKSYLNQFYYKSDTLISNRPLYISSDKTKGIWYDGDESDEPDWVVGSISDLNQGKLTYGFMLNDESVDCPTDSNDWKESHDGSWLNNYEISMKCS